MQKIPFGKTGLSVSALCLGCMYFGTLLDEQTSWQMADQYFEAGGRFFDTANNYAFWINGQRGGESEDVLGRWMKERQNRDQLFLATKVGARPTLNGAGFEHAEGLSALAITRAIDESLTRLGTDYLDLYYAHIDDRTTPLEETLEAFDRLVKAGKVRYIGCSNIRAWRIEQARGISAAHNWASYCCVQQRYTYVRPGAGTDFSPQVSVNDDLLDYCKTYDDLALLAYSPLLGGAYTRSDRPFPPEYSGPDTAARLRALRTVSSQLGATLNQVVLAWLLHSRPVALPLIAASTGEQLQENIDALKLQLSPEQMALLSDARDQGS